ncbi:gluconate 5-dehydrogenase [Plectosphaerella cucumerina]|uniref:Gluconate 5-dehydrogenase n=1 Tax=Plectosphaerella cucumerina TaxID=40658 RepID=A0A8K0TAM1_9PEZI|nr:gluconate 5-dehydrogenase [Plectosphaerella cucumerina]
MSASRALLPLRGRHCLITGASGGIGAAIARRFAADGALVTLTGRNESKLQSVLSQLTPYGQSGLSPVDSSKATPPSTPQASLEHSYKVLDLSASPKTGPNEDSYELQHATLDSIWQRTGQIDVLVNAAGVAQWQLLQKTSLDEARDMLDTNLMGAILTSKFLARQMKRRTADRDACIINISSLLAQKGVPGASVYAASKAGLLGLTTALAAELSPFRIRTNAIVPGYIETDMLASMSREALEKKIPLRRLGTSDEVADAAAFLAQNPYANNCILNLDGGLSAI